ncbi:hypothetical protein NX059_012284 [Plenodomus lindquistii]|nr:hypothetical protein NX059_012284 [Plenodomus lindquistii]
MQDIELFRIIYTAVDNFLVYYSRLNKPAREALAKARQSLKEVKDVVKLASWKDTNIEALKQIAKTSHRKLSKLVRKFRALLDQPVSDLVNPGFPNLTRLMQAVAMPPVLTVTNAEALELGAGSRPGWQNRRTRFKNFGLTISMMRNLSTVNNESIDGAAYINDFIADMTSSMLDLQKATPPTLTEENKESMQHRKTQKCKLYVVMMKGFRQMSVNYNLSVDTFSEQDELYTILSTMPSVQGNREFGNAAEYHLHKALSAMP